MQASGGFVTLGEVFHNEPLKDAAGTFLAFAKERDIRLTDTSTRAGAAAIADRYLSWLRGMAVPKHLVIDVKLNSWSVLTSWWRYPSSEPFFLSRLKREQAVFIFVWRENLPDQLLSRFIAREFGIWHNLTAARVAGRTLEAPVGRLKELAALVVRAEVDMLDHLRDYPARVIMRYEDLFQNGVLSKQFKSAFRKVAGIALPDECSAGIRQNSVAKRDIIQNYDEVRTALASLVEHRRREWELRQSAGTDDRSDQ
jgi:hypothetical protein